MHRGTSVVKRLLCGCESRERVELMMGETGIRSERVKSAIIDHLVKGYPVAQAAIVNGETDSNVRRGLDVLERMADMVEKVKEIDWAKHSVK
jgi:hypothetical protein